MIEVFGLFVMDIFCVDFVWMMDVVYVGFFDGVVLLWVVDDELILVGFLEGLMFVFKDMVM